MDDSRIAVEDIGPANDNSLSGEVGESNVGQCKRLLQEAGDASGNPAWESGGMERMYFEHPTSKTLLGSVEIDTTGTELSDARLELFAPPAVIAEVVRFVRSLPIVEKVPTKSEEVTVPLRAPLPPTREPTPEDLQDEPDGLPPEVLATDIDADQVEL
jgi:hypothetical protein